MSKTFTKAQANCRLIDEEIEGVFKIDKSGMVSSELIQSMYATYTAGNHEAIHPYHR
jgi:hypothetical protein